MIFLNKITIKNIKSYIQGMYRNFKYKKELSKISFDNVIINKNNWENTEMNAKDITTIEQYMVRIWLVSKKSPVCLTKECYCGCTTPELFFANKACEGYKDSNGVVKTSCYPVMMDKELWDAYKKVANIDMIEVFNFYKKYNNERNSK